MSADDLVFTPGRLLITAIALLVTFIFINKFFVVFSPFLANTTASTFLSKGTNAINTLAGYGFFAVFIALAIGSFVLAMRLPTSILWTPFFAILTLVATWISVPISQAYEKMISSNVFASYSTQMQIATLVMSKLPLLILLMGSILAIATFVKYRGEQVMPV